MEYEDMRRMEKTHICSQCGANLVIIWDMQADCYRLFCSHDHSHQGYKQTSTAGQALARGVIDNHLGPGAQKDMEKQAEHGAPALSWLADKDIATGELLTREKLGSLIAWGDSLGLKPYLGHVCLYYGKPYVTIDGYYYKLNKNHPAIRIGTRPLTQEEREQELILEGAHAWIAEAWENGEKLPTTGLGIATKEEIEAKSTRKPEEFRAPVVHGHPQRVSEKRAEWQLLRKIVSLEEKGGED